MVRMWGMWTGGISVEIRSGFLKTLKAEPLHRPVPLLPIPKYCISHRRHTGLFQFIAALSSSQVGESARCPSVDGEWLLNCREVSLCTGQVTDSKWLACSALNGTSVWIPPLKTQGTSWKSGWWWFERYVPTGSFIWTLGLWMVVQCGFRVQPCWKSCVTGSGLGMFKEPHLSGYSALYHSCGSKCEPSSRCSCHTCLLPHFPQWWGGTLTLWNGKPPNPFLL